MKIGSRYYADYGYCGVFDKTFELVWNDNPSVFKKLMQHKEKFCAVADSDLLSDISPFVFRFDGRNCCAVFSIVKQEFIMCRVYPEKDNEASVSELSAELDSISCGALNVINYVNSISRSLKNNDFDNLGSYLKAQQQDAEIIYSECFNISNRFIGKTTAVFVPLRRNIIEVFEKIERMTSKLRGRILCLVDIEYEFAKIDYYNFRKAVYNIAKLFFRFSDKNAEMRICSVDDNELTVSFGFTTDTEIDTASCETEVRCIKSVFSLLSGCADIDISGKAISLNASLPLMFTSSYEKAEKFNAAVIKRGSGINESFAYPGGSLSRGSYMHCNKKLLSDDLPDDYGSVIFGSLIGDFD